MTKTRDSEERFAPDFFAMAPFLYKIIKLFKAYSGYKSLKCCSYRIKNAEGTSMSSFKNTVERIRALEAERKNLLLEIEELKRMADAKAKALESEINMLRDEVKSLRILLSGEELEADSGQKKKK
jgi:uncharacterized protein (UPF0335 family)